MNDLMEKLGLFAKAMAYLAWALGGVFLVAPLVDGKPIDWQAPPAMATGGAIWWLLGWWLQQRGKK